MFYLAGNIKIALCKDRVGPRVRGLGKPWRLVPVIPLGPQEGDPDPAAVLEALACDRPGGGPAGALAGAGDLPALRDALSPPGENGLRADRSSFPSKLQHPPPSDSKDRASGPRPAFPVPVDSGKMNSEVPKG